MGFDPKTLTIGELMDNTETRTIVVEMAPVLDGIPLDAFIRGLTVEKCSPQIQRIVGNDVFDGMMAKLMKLNA